MKDLRTMLKLLVVALVAAVALGAMMTGRSAVRGHYEYQTLTAPRTLHQMTIEMEESGRSDRASLPILGAGMMAMVVLAFLGFLFAMHGGTALLKEGRLSRRKRNRRRDDRLTIAPTPPIAPLLGDGQRDEREYPH